MKRLVEVNVVPAEGPYDYYELENGERLLIGDPVERILCKTEVLTDENGNVYQITNQRAPQLQVEINHIAGFYNPNGGTDNENVVLTPEEFHALCVCAANCDLCQYKLECFEDCEGDCNHCSAEPCNHCHHYNKFVLDVDAAKEAASRYECD